MPTPQVPAQRWVPRKLVPVFSADKMLLHATFRLPFLKRHFDKGFDLNGVRVTYGPPSTSCAPTHILITAPTEASLQEALNRYQQLVSNIVVILIERESEPQVTSLPNPPSSTLMPHTDARNDDSSAVTVSVNNPPSLIAQQQKQQKNQQQQPNTLHLLHSIPGIKYVHQ